MQLLQLFCVFFILVKCFLELCRNCINIFRRRRDDKRIIIFDRLWFSAASEAYLRSEANAELTIKLHRVVMVTVRWCREARVVGLLGCWPVRPTLLDASAKRTTRKENGPRLVQSFFWLHTCRPPRRKVI